MTIRFTLAEFAAHLELLTTKTPILLMGLADGAGKALETQAKHEIGNPIMYDLQTGHFSAWPLLAEDTERDKARMGAPGSSPLLRTGQMHDCIEYHAYKDFGLYTAVMGCYDPKIYFHEFGTMDIAGHMPPRPVIGTALFIRLPDILLTSRFALGKFLSGTHKPWVTGAYYHLQMGGNDSLWRG